MKQVYCQQTKVINLYFTFRKIVNKTSLIYNQTLQPVNQFYINLNIKIRIKNDITTTLLLTTSTDLVFLNVSKTKGIQPVCSAD